MSVLRVVLFYIRSDYSLSQMNVVENYHESMSTIFYFQFFLSSTLQLLLDCHMYKLYIASHCIRNRTIYICNYIENFVLSCAHQWQFCEYKLLFKICYFICGMDRCKRKKPIGYFIVIDKREL